MYGRFVHEAVLSAKERVTGVTVHIVDEHYDHGPVVDQSPVEVLEDDTVESLGARVLAREHGFLVETLNKIATGAIDLDRITELTTAPTTGAIEVGQDVLGPLAGEPRPEVRG